MPVRIGFPASLAGRRCLDVGTRDGFWAFEMERRGAAEVVAIDLTDHRRLDWPGDRPPELAAETLAGLAARDSAFEIASEALGSSVRRRELSIYDLSTDAAGEFDFVFLGTLLLHLRDPIGGLIAVRRVMRPDAELLVNDVVSLRLLALRRPAAELLTVAEPFWWACNPAGLRRMVQAAGFDVVAAGGPYFEPNGSSRRVAPIHGLSTVRERLHRAVLRRFGAPHAWVRARPS